MAVFDNLNMTTSAGLAPQIVEYHSKRLLKNILPNLVNARDMQMVPLPANNGRRVQLRKPVPLPIDLTPLSEGVTPDGQKLTMTDLWITIKPYAKHMEYTDEINWALLDRNTEIMTKLLSDQAALTLDTLAAEAKASGLNVQYANGKTGRDKLAAGDVLTYKEMKKAVRTLQRANAQKFPDGFYHATIDPDTEFDLTNDPMWIDVAKYQDKRKVETGELGCMAGVKFFSTTNVKTFGGAEHLYDSVASLAIKASGYDKATRKLTLSAPLTDDACRKLMGRMFAVKTGSSSFSYENVYVENATTDGVLTLRWPLSDATVSALAANSPTLVPEGTGTGTVHATVVYGQDFAGGVALDGTGDNVQMIIKPLGSSGAADPVNQRGTVAWKVRGVGYSVIQDAFGVRIEHMTTA